MALSIDFSSQDFFRAPLAALEGLRLAGPAVEVRLPIMGRVWMTTTQEMASRVLKDNQAFTLRKDDGGRCRSTLVDAEHISRVCQKYAHR